MSEMEHPLPKHPGTCLPCGGTGRLVIEPFVLAPASSVPTATSTRCSSCDGTGNKLSEQQILEAGQRRLEAKRIALGITGEKLQR